MFGKARTLLFLSFILIILLSCNPVILSQNAPVTTAATIGGALPGTVTVPVTATGFNNIGAISLCLDYDYSVIHFDQGVPNPQIPSFTIVDNDLGTGYHRLIMGWFGPGTSLANGSAIMTIIFTYISGVSTLAWFDNGSSCEYADGNYNVLNDIPQPTYYINGYVCGGIGSPGPIIGDNSVCEGQQGVAYSIAPVANATGYIWTVPAGATIVSGDSTNFIVVDYSMGALSGIVSVYGVNGCENSSASQLYITVDQLPTATISGGDSLCDDGSTTNLAIGLSGIPPWLFVWSDGVNSFNVSNQMTTPYIITTSDPGTYTVLFVQDANCIGASYGSATVTVSPIPATPAIVQDNFELVSSSCCGNQWYLNGNAISGATGQTYVPTMLGDYFDIVTLNGCSSDTSNILTVTIISVEQKRSANFRVYPNPAGERLKFTISPQGSRHFKLQFINIHGVKVKEVDVDFLNTENEKEINIEDVSPGFYLLMIREQNQTIFTKLVKN